MATDIINNALSELELKITGSAHVCLDKHWHNSHVCDYYTRLYFVKSGNGYLETETQKIKISGGNMYMIPANTEFSYGCEKLEKVFFHVSVYGLEHYDMLSGINEIFSMPFPESNYQKLIDMYDSDDYMKLLEVKTFLAKTILAFAKEYNFPRFPIKQYSETVKKILNHIDCNLRFNLSIREISEQTFISESKIRKAFRDETGQTIGNYIKDMVFLQAKNQLENENITVKSVSDSFGFCDQFYFSKKFKERFGKTPSQHKNDSKIL